MKHRNLVVIPLLAASLAVNAQSLKETVGKHFLIGTALGVDQINGLDPATMEVVKKQFNAVVPENCMKPEHIEPREGVFTWTDADNLVKLAEENGLTLTGHVLIWHNQTPDWLFDDGTGNMPNRETMIERMRQYIHTVVTHFKGKIKGWDVVNEALNDDGTLRNTKWLRAIGPEYITLAFKFAHEADPDVELYYNDYSLSLPKKREGMLKIVRQLQQEGCRIDAVGMQSHNHLDYPSLEDYEATMKAIIAQGIKLQVTELDISVLPNPQHFSGAEVTQNFAMDKTLNPYTKSLPKEIQQKLTDRYVAFFSLYKKYQQHIKRVTLWGVNDAMTWLNDFPVKGRTNYPLLFDRKNKAKPAVKAITQLFEDKK